MRYAIISATFIACIAAVPFDRPAFPAGPPNPDDDCEISWVTANPEPTSSMEATVSLVPTTNSSAVVYPLPTVNSSIVEPAETSPAEETNTRHHRHRVHRPHTRRPTRQPETSTTTTSAETNAEPTDPGSPSFPYPSPSPTQMTWTAGNGQKLNSAAHSTSYTDPATATVEPQCTAAASDYVKAALDGHNEKRAAHQANPVIWDEGLSCVAQRQAASCLFDHLMYVNGGGYGQNLAGGTGTTITDSIEMWYGEAPEYDPYYGQSSPPFVAGHFTQLVWASTTSIGCATHTCDGSTGTFTGELTVCNYFIFGNMGGAYKENVLPAAGTSSSGL